MKLFDSGYEVSGGSREMRPPSEIDPLSGQLNQLTPVSPKAVEEVWLALGRELIAVRLCTHALALGVGAENLWVRPPLWDGRIDLPEPDGGELRLVIAEDEVYAIGGPAPRHSMASTRTGRRRVFVEHVPIV